MKVQCPTEDRRVIGEKKCGRGCPHRLGGSRLNEGGKREKRYLFPRRPTQKRAARVLKSVSVDLVEKSLNGPCSTGKSKEGGGIGKDESQSRRSNGANSGWDDYL